jgi:hypothetical protein
MLVAGMYLTCIMGGAMPGSSKAACAGPRTFAAKAKGAL